MIVGERIGLPHSMPGIGWVVLLQSVLFLGVGGYFGFRSAKLALHGEATHGTVVAYSTPTSKGSKSPILELTTKDGRRFRFEAMQSSRTSSPAIGTHLPVRYSPDDPNVSAVESFEEMWLLPSVFLPLGFVCLVAAPILIVIGRRRIRARARAKASGWHVPAVVVGSQPVAMRGTTHYVPEVEIRDPGTNAAVRCRGDRQPSLPATGGKAVVHIDQAPPHGYFVETS